MKREQFPVSAHTAVKYTADAGVVFRKRHAKIYLYIISTQ